MEAELILYPHTESSFEVRCLMWDFLAHFLMSSSRISAWKSLKIVAHVSRRCTGGSCTAGSTESGRPPFIRPFQDGWIRDQYAHLFSNARRSEGEIDQSNPVPSEGGPSSQLASVHRTSSSIMESGLVNNSRTTSEIEVRRSVRASLTAIFDIRLKHLHFLFKEEPESHVEQIQRAILNNEPRRHWGSVTKMYRFYEGRIRAWHPHRFSKGRVTGDKSDFPAVDHSGAFTMDAMMRTSPLSDRQ